MQVQSILQKKDEIMSQWTSGSIASNRKILTGRRQLYPEINEKVYEWFVAARAKKVPVSGRMLQDHAANLAEQMGYADFSASNGWLRSFRQRHAIHHSALCGESAEVTSISSFIHVRDLSVHRIV